MTRVQKRVLSGVGLRLIEAYEAKGITSARDIGARLGFKSGSSIYKVFSGERELSFDALRRFAKQTGYSIDWLLTGDGPPEIGGNSRAAECGLLNANLQLMIQQNNVITEMLKDMRRRIDLIS